MVDQYDAFFGTYANVTSHLKWTYLEIGNEPDRYASTNTSLWDYGVYVSTWEKTAASILSAIDLTKSNAPKLQYSAVSVPSSGTGLVWSPTELLGSGVIDSAPWKDVGAYSMHSYQVSLGDAECSKGVDNR